MLGKQLEEKSKTRLCGINEWNYWELLEESRHVWKQ